MARREGYQDVDEGEKGVFEAGKQLNDSRQENIWGGIRRPQCGGCTFAPDLVVSRQW